MIWDLGDAFCEDVEKASGGRLKITHLAGGTLTPNTDILKSCTAGMFEMGWHDPAYITGFMPEAAIGTSPFMLRNMMDVLELYYHRGVKEFFQDSYAPLGVHPVGFTSHWVIPLFSTKPIERVSDFKGLKVRTIGARAIMCDALGASSTYIPLPEVYTALAAGTVEAATNGAEESLLIGGWEEVCKYISYPALSQFPLPVNDVFVSSDAWDSLPPDLQAILEMCGDKLITRFAEWARHYDIEARPKLDAAGVTRVYLPDEDLPAMAEAASVVWTDIAKSSARGWEIVRITTDYMREMGYADYDVRVAVPQ
jgi:TRAP-type C4-dicarboxylate transport system substrate-binding protein